jgi:peptidoglycan/xylan/chitin deacetylase (PgdA/CDA1 family)
VPGITARRHPDEVSRLATGPHEVAHHGHAHLRPDTMDAAGQRADLLAGIAALEAVTGTRPVGYRAPGWELTPATLEALVVEGFAFDSSLMGDDAPYVHATSAGALVELPVHWTLDDAPFFEHATDPSGLQATWLAELDAAHRERRHVTFTLHPEILGRPHRAEVLRRLLHAVTELRAPVLPHGAVAAALAIRA